jgi:hypothetical protein
MTARDNHDASVKAASKSATATLTVNEATRQTTIDAKLSVVGYNLQTGNNANLLAAVKSANDAKVAADSAAEQAKQAAIMVARDTLRDTGDRGPF